MHLVRHHKGGVEAKSEVADDLILIGLVLVLLPINSENIFPIIKKWLYSDHDIFFRELISNGCDALTKLHRHKGAVLIDNLPRPVLVGKFQAVLI